MKYLHYFLILFSILFSGCGDSSLNKEELEEFYLSLNSDEKLVTNTAGAFEIYISSNGSWKITSSDTWLQPERTEGEGNLAVRIKYDGSTSEKRTGVLTFEGEDGTLSKLTVIQTRLTFENPIAGIPDPWITKHNGYYYICKASGDGINISRSSKLSEITPTKTVWRCPIDNGDIKPWNVTHVWAPELHRIDGRWYIYYTAGRPRSELGYYQQRSGVLRAKTDDPLGEWEDMGMLYTGDNYQEGVKATIANTLYAIDLTVAELNNTLYAVWSGGIEGTPGQFLYIAKMSNPHTISSQRQMISRPDQSWELVSPSNKINEGPAFLKSRNTNKLFVVYSCNGSWTKDYRLGYVMMGDTLADPLVPANWIKSSNSVFYRCDDTSDSNGVNGVGHCSFTKSQDDTEDWIVYHVKNRNDNSYSSGRSTFVQKFGWNADGTPDFGEPVGWGEIIAAPSGEKN